MSIKFPFSKVEPAGYLDIKRGKTVRIGPNNLVTSQYLVNKATGKKIPVTRDRAFFIELKREEGNVVTALSLLKFGEHFVIYNSQDKVLGIAHQEDLLPGYEIQKR